jgi:hypothetical protein
VTLSTRLGEVRHIKLLPRAGTKVQFEGVETIFAREVTRGSETFVFRDKDGMPIW